MHAQIQACQNTRKAVRHAPAIAHAPRRHALAARHAAGPMFDDPEVILIDPEFDSFADSLAGFDSRDRYL